MLSMVLAGFLACGDTAPAPDVGLRRLSVHEYDTTLQDVLREPGRPGRALLPADRERPFDNASETQDPSLVLVEAAESLAISVSDRLVSDPARLAEVLPCEPTEPRDETCLREYVEVVGRRLLRRPLEPDHVTALTELARPYLLQEGFEAGVDMVTRALLQDPAFLYRIEQGEVLRGDRGVRLDGFSVAARLSYLLWGSAPDDALLDAAAAGELDSAEGIRAHAERMLESSTARDQVDRFHAMWLGYQKLPHEAWLTSALRDEVRALMERVVFDERRPWSDLLTFDQRWVSPELATHYGDGDSVATTGWTAAPDGRRGLLGTGAFLSVGAAVADTSPVRRGKLIRERLFCSPIPPPPPGVEADNPPPAELAQCKVDRYNRHREDPACAGCHNQMDPIGFGLERYDRQGVYRTHDDGVPECTIDGVGEVVPFGDFSGPEALARLALANEIDACLVDHVLQYALGRELTGADAALHTDLLGSFRRDGRFDALLLDLVTHPSFALRQETTP